MTKGYTSCPVGRFTFVWLTNETSKLLKALVDWVRCSFLQIMLFGNHVWIYLHTYGTIALGMNAEMM